MFRGRCGDRGAPYQAEALQPGRTLTLLSCPTASFVNADKTGVRSDRSRNHRAPNAQSNTAGPRAARPASPWGVPAGGGASGARGLDGAADGGGDPRLIPRAGGRGPRGRGVGRFVDAAARESHARRCFPSSGAADRPSSTGAAIRRKASTTSAPSRAGNAGASRRCSTFRAAARFRGHGADLW